MIKPLAKQKTSNRLRFESVKVTPTYMDVLCGTSTERFTQLGNELFISTVVAHADYYLRASSKKEKMRVSKLIYDCLTESGVRFLKKGVGEDHHWYLASEKVGRDRIGHSLRQQSSKRTTESREKSNFPLSLSKQVKCSLLNVSSGIHSAISLEAMLLSMNQGIDTSFCPNPLYNDQKEAFEANVAHEDEGILPDVPFDRVASDTFGRLQNDETQSSGKYNFGMISNDSSQLLSKTSVTQEDFQLFDDADLAECLDW